jgi:hypothetical protein
MISLEGLRATDPRLGEIRSRYGKRYTTRYLELPHVAARECTKDARHARSLTHPAQVRVNRGMTDIPRSSNTPAALADELANLFDDDPAPWATDPLPSIEARASWWRVVDSLTGVFDDSSDALTGDDLRAVVAIIGRDLVFADGDPVAALMTRAKGLLSGDEAVTAWRLSDPRNVAEALLAAAVVVERLDLAGLLQPMLADVRAYVRAALEVEP